MQFRLPGTRIQVLPECGVALAQRPTESGPVLQESWFHVEHSPVQPAAALCRSALHQPMNLGIDDFHEERRRQFSQALDIAAVQSGGIGFVPAILEPDPVGADPAVWAKTVQVVGVASDEAVRVPRPEGSAPPDQESRLEDGSLARSRWRRR